MKMLIALAALSAGGALAVLAQEQGPPPVLQIQRELIKEGKFAAHEKTEAAYVRAFRKADFPGHYLALSPQSGPNEVWFVEAFPSFEASETWQAASEKEPLKSALADADAQDGVLRERSNSMWAVYRPQLSYRADKLDVGKMRFVRVFTYHVRLGRTADFLAEAAAVIRAYDRANADRSFLGYEVRAGAPAGTYLFLEGLTSLKTLDGWDEQSQAFASAMGAFAIIGFVGTGQFAVNQFGYVGNGLRRYLLLPADPAAALRSGSYTFVLLDALLIAAGLVVWPFLSPGRFDPLMMLLLAGCSLTGMFLYLAAGVWVSLLAARRGNYYSSFGNDLSFAGNVLLIAAILSMVFLPRMAAGRWPDVFWSGYWWVTLGAAALAAGIYWMSLDRAAAWFRSRRERLVAIMEGRS